MISHKYEKLLSRILKLTFNVCGTFTLAEHLWWKYLLSAFVL